MSGAVSDKLKTFEPYRKWNILHSREQIQLLEGFSFLVHTRYTNLTSLWNSASFTAVFTLSAPDQVCPKETQKN